jgi:hypothetical protein
MIKLKSLFRRGQSGSPAASSSSKQSQQISPAHSVGLKASASASSLDRNDINNAGSASADLGATRKLSKGHHKQSSKDKLNDLLRVASKEKLIDEKKELKRQQKQQKQMQQVAQQSANVHLPSSSVAATGHLPNNQHSGRSNSKDFDVVVTYDEVQDVSIIKKKHASVCCGNILFTFNLRLLTIETFLPVVSYDPLLFDAVHAAAKFH